MCIKSCSEKSKYIGYTYLNCFVSNLFRKMNHLNDLGNLLCRKTEYSVNKYSYKIQISGFTAQTTLDDLRIRFSLYGSIKDCYFVSHPRTERLAYIIFDKTCAMNAVEFSHIYLHGQKLRVHNEKFIEKKELKFDLINVPGNTLHINDLDDDSLLNIFEYLSIVEKLKLTQVCTRWYILANMSLQTAWHLNLGIYSKDLNNFDNFNHGQQFMKLLQNLEQRKLRVGKSLSYYRRYPPLNVIASLNMHLLAMDCRNLTKLIIQCSTYDEHILSRILMANKELRHIEIIGNPYITGKSLIHLSEKIHTFIVEHSRNLQSNHICAALKRLKNLKYLRLDSIAWDVANIFNEYCQNLETLILDGDFMPLNPRNFNIFLPVTNLTNLRDLQIITYAHITETFIVNLCQNCQELRRLEFYPDNANSWHISKRAMNAITSLPKLEELSIQSIGLELANLHGLHKINIRDCYDVQEEQVVSVIWNSPELRYLNIYGCLYITEQIFSEARAISASRCNDVMLELFTGNLYNECKRCVIYNGKIY